MTDGGDLIELFPSEPGEETDEDAPLKRKRRDYTSEPYCSHGRVTLHEESRRVYCRSCKREVPAFDALTNLAVEWERYIVARDHARQEAKRSESRLEDLKRQEANAKSRLRTTRKKLTRADPVWARLEELVPRSYLTGGAVREALYGDDEASVVRQTGSY